jgi:DNA gyrase subunit B
VGEYDAREYDASQITVLTAQQAIRKRPGMYAGDVDDGSAMYNLLLGVVANSVEEHLDGHASYVRVAFHDDGAVSVDDDGGGIPIGTRPSEPGLTALELVMTRLFGGCGPRSQRVALGGGVCLAVVNALSSRLEAETVRDGRRYRQEYAAGEALGPLRDLGPTDRRGTRIRFRPDFAILPPRPWDRALVARRLREIAALTPRLTTIVDDRAFRCPDGLADHVRFLGRGQRARHDDPVHVRGERDGVTVEAALLWTAGARPRLRAFACHAPTPGGTHVRGLADGLFQAFVALDRARFGTVHRAAFREVVRPGLAAAVHVTLEDARFADWRRQRLLNVEARAAVAAVLAEQLAARLRDDRGLREALLATMPISPSPR